MVDGINKALSMLSIAVKAGKVVSGGFMTQNALQQGIASLVIIAKDASDNTKKKFTNKCDYYKVPYVIISDSETIGKRIGKEARIVVAITEEGLAKQILCKLDSNNMEV